MQTLNDETTESLLCLYSGVLEELRRRGLVRSNNNPAADYSERIAARALGLTLTDKSQKGHDATDTEGLRYQIKCRRLTSRNTSREMGILRNMQSRLFDRLVGILFDAQFRVFRACVVPFDVVQNRAAFNEHAKGHKFHLHDDVWGEPGVLDVTEQFITSATQVCEECDGRILLGVQQTVPLPEAADYQVQVREKGQCERTSRTSKTDRTLFDVTVAGETYRALGKGRAILRVVQRLVTGGTDPQEIADAMEEPLQKRWRSVRGEIGATTFRISALEKTGYCPTFDERRWFCQDGDLIHFGGRTYAFTNQWGAGDWRDAMNRIIAAFPESAIKFTPNSRRWNM